MIEQKGLKTKFAIIDYPVPARLHCGFIVYSITGLHNVNTKTYNMPSTQRPLNYPNLSECRIVTNAGVGSPQTGPEIGALARNCHQMLEAPLLPPASGFIDLYDFSLGKRCFWK